jgi:hypothetical protein
VNISLEIGLFAFRFKLRDFYRGYCLVSDASAQQMPERLQPHRPQARLLVDVPMSRSSQHAYAGMSSAYLMKVNLFASGSNRP